MRSLPLKLLQNARFPYLSQRRGKETDFFLISTINCYVHIAKNDDANSVVFSARRRLHPSHKEALISAKMVLLPSKQFYLPLGMFALVSVEAADLFGVGEF